ncbi:unnamed protein product [Rhodiola kirilowii]
MSKCPVHTNFDKSSVNANRSCDTWFRHVRPIKSMDDQDRVSLPHSYNPDVAESSPIYM